MGHYGHGLSLLTGWLPVAIPAVTAAVLLVALVRRAGRRWYLVWLPVAAVVGLAASLLVREQVTADGLTDDPAPVVLWIWIGVAVGAAVVAVVGWRRTPWWRRTLSILAVPLAVLCVASVLNQWVGYYPTVQEAWGAATAGPLPDEVDDAQLASLASASTRPAHGALLGVDIPATASGFTHREEYVYLPPAWFTGSDHHPALPALMMVGGEFNTPADWIRTGNALDVVDGYAAAHGGLTPILVFVDSGGSFNNDTQCVNGPRGNSADHLTEDVRPSVVSRFGASAEPASWGVVGWSMGGTCAVDLAVMHPELFGTFEDIAGDLGPAVGGKDETISRLYGGNAAAWARFDPLTVLAAHGRYADTAGWFEDSSGGGPGSGPGGRPGFAFRGGPRRPTGSGFGGQADPGAEGSEPQEAAQLCTAMTAQGIACTLHTTPGGHTWQVAATSFADAFPWLVGRVQGGTGVGTAQTTSTAGVPAAAAAVAPTGPTAPAGNTGGATAGGTTS
ncbi:esterase family protein [Pseudonocardia kujensis]|uniref:alpha/beta hydrolase n=1 Tax=Pseudonocardia kujensis TaxID=1128675 RepID=UPI001E5C82A4|nr:alpha/beta hydrolase-fold protein [Pseudonocardia kujensis]MCE0766302.1 esterase family protein [Pseudonocardia kujensis]